MPGNPAVPYWDLDTTVRWGVEALYPPPNADVRAQEAEQGKQGLQFLLQRYAATPDYSRVPMAGLRAPMSPAGYFMDPLPELPPQPRQAQPNPFMRFLQQNQGRPRVGVDIGGAGNTGRELRQGVQPRYWTPQLQFDQQF